MKSKRCLILIGTAVMFSCISSAVPVPCADGANYGTYLGYNTTGGCFIGDKLFDNFSYSSTATGGAVPVAATSIIVNTIGPLGTNATIVGPEFGFRFNFVWFAGPGQTQDSVFDFGITTISGDPLISDESLLMVDGFTGTGNAVVDETLCLGGPIVGCPAANIRQERTFAGSTGTGLSDHIVFPVQNTISLIKDVQVVGGI